MITIRPSTSSASDAKVIPRLVNEAAAWLISEGSTQWGSDPSADRPNTLAHSVPGDFATGQAFFAVLSSPSPTDPSSSASSDSPNERVVGAMVLSEEPYAYSAPTPPERRGKEVTLKLLTTDRTLKGQDIGGQLLAFARDECRRRGIEWLRGDCYRAVEPEKDRLIKYYEKNGFKRVGQFEVPDKWEKGLLFMGWFYEMRL